MVAGGASFSFALKPSLWYTIRKSIRIEPCKMIGDSPIELGFIQGELTMMVHTRIDEDLQQYYFALQEKESMEDADIMRLLDACRIKFKVDFVYIAEALTSHKGYVFTHVSYSEDQYNLRGKIYAAPDELRDEELLKYDEDGLCDKIPDNDVRKADYGVLYYGILQNRECDGTVGMVDFHGKRNWTQEERLAMQKVGRVLKYVVFTERYGRENAVDNEKLENQSQVLEAIFSSTDCGMIRHTVHGNRILGINRAALKILGYKSKTELERAGFDLIAASVVEEDKQRLRECLRHLDKVGDSADIEYRVCHKDGTMLDVNGKIKLLMENGELIYQRILLDRTAQKRSEEMQRWEEQKQQFEMIRALCGEYTFVYLVDIDTGIAIPYHTNKERTDQDRASYAEKFLFEERTRQYIEEVVYEEDREYLYLMSSAEHLRMELDMQDSLNVNYRIEQDGEIEYYQMKLVRMGGWQAGKHQLVVGIHSVDDEMRSEISQKELIEESYEIIASLSSDYNFIGLINCEARTISAYKASGDSPELMALTSSDNYDDAISAYTNYVHDEDKEMWQEATNLEHILDQLQEENIYNINLRNNAEEPDYIQFRFTKILEQGHDYQLVLAKRIITETIKKEMEQRKALEKALRQEEYANQAKSTFLSNMSHDIRTPINGIMGMGHIAMNALGDPERVEDCLRKILESSEHLLGLINDVLDMSRIESGKIFLNHEFMDMKLTIGHCVAIIQGQLVDREIEFVQELSEFQNPYRIGDELRLRQILVNILGNAVKFTPDGGKIRFRVEELSATGKETMVRFEVEDTGIGMSPEFLEHIWEPFSQANSGSRTNYEGTGLGMSITKQFIDLMGGTIAVESQLNQGSKFTIEVPLEITDLKPFSEEEPAECNLNGMKILVAEDNALNMEIIQCVLEEEKIEVFQAENGKIAVEKFQESNPGYYDAILMDIMMPIMDGLDAARAIRALERPDAKEIPIIAMTANAYDEDVKKTKRAGMNAHLTKPLDIPTVISVLSEYYGK